MGVKGIFKVLIGTVVALVASMLIIEVFNMTITSMQINKLSKTAAYQACALFTQESYGERYEGKGSEILDNKGKVYCDGEFYKQYGITGPNPDPEKIYTELFGKRYISEDHFYGLMQTEEMKDYIAPQLLYMRLLTGDTDYPINALNFSSGDLDIQRNSDLSKANLYYNNRYTPANLGIPYINPWVTTDMFEWSLTQLLSNCNSANIWSKGTTVEGKLGDKVGQSGSNTAVYYKGFLCYASDDTTKNGLHAQITDISYKTYDLTTKDGRDGLTADTGTIVQGPPADSSAGIGASKIAPHSKGFGSTDLATGVRGISWSSEYRTGASEKTSDKCVSVKMDYVGGKEITLPTIDKDNALVTVATVEYSVPYEYVGITPLKSLMAFVWDKEVSGLNGGAPTATSGDTMTNSIDTYDTANIDTDEGLNAYHKIDKITFMLAD